MAISDNIVFILNSSLEFVYFNEKAKEAFPHFTIGKKYTGNVGFADILCDDASLLKKNSSPTMLYNSHISRWVQFSA